MEAEQTVAKNHALDDKIIDDTIADSCNANIALTSNQCPLSLQQVSVLLFFLFFKCNKAAVNLSFTAALTLISFYLTGGYDNTMSHFRRGVFAAFPMGFSVVSYVISRLTKNVL